MADRAEPSAASKVSERSPATLAGQSVAVVREVAGGERRVALVPDDVGKLGAAGFAVLVEEQAGEQAWFFDDAYAQAGATVADRARCLADSDVVLYVGRPTDADLKKLKSGQVVIGMLAPLVDPGFAAAARRGVVSPP